jgi:hypothetical protein
MRQLKKEEENTATAVRTTNPTVLSYYLNNLRGFSIDITDGRIYEVCC